jgi:hypothetical protein
MASDFTVKWQYSLRKHLINQCIFINQTVSLKVVQIKKN